MYPLAYLLFYILSGFFLGTTIVAIYIYNPIASNVIECKTKYEKKYIDEFNKLEDRPLSDEEKKGLKDKVIYEKTPQYNVLMYYNSDLDIF